MNRDDYSLFVERAALAAWIVIAGLGVLVLSGWRP